MYLKRIEGPRAITLPDGTVMTRADLPDPKTRRWVASRKAAVVRAVRHGLLTQTAAIDMYDLSEEELESWIAATETHGEAALKATSLQKWRVHAPRYFCKDGLRLVQIPKGRHGRRRSSRINRVDCSH